MDLLIWNCLLMLIENFIYLYIKYLFKELYINIGFYNFYIYDYNFLTLIISLLVS